MFDESQHPRKPKGDPTGGEFTMSGGKPVPDYIMMERVEDYGMAHRPNDDLETSASLDDLTTNGYGDGFIPKDFYEKPQNYANISDKAGKESWEAIKAARGKPEADVTIYRSAPKRVTKINDGDWVTLSKTYAEMHTAHTGENEKHTLLNESKSKAFKMGCKQYKRIWILSCQPKQKVK